MQVQQVPLTVSMTDFQLVLLSLRYLPEDTGKRVSNWEKDRWKHCLCRGADDKSHARLTPGLPQQGKREDMQQWMKKRNSGRDRRLGISLSGRPHLPHMKLWVQSLEPKETINAETKNDKGLEWHFWIFGFITEHRNSMRLCFHFNPWCGMWGCFRLSTLIFLCSSRGVTFTACS